MVYTHTARKQWRRRLLENSHCYHDMGNKCYSDFILDLANSSHKRFMYLHPQIRLMNKESQGDMLEALLQILRESDDSVNHVLLGRLEQALISWFPVHQMRVADEKKKKQGSETMKALPATASQLPSHAKEQRKEEGESYVNFWSMALNQGSSRNVDQATKALPATFPDNEDSGTARNDGTAEPPTPSLSVVAENSARAEAQRLLQVTRLSNFAAQSILDDTLSKLEQSRFCAHLAGMRLIVAPGCWIQLTRDLSLRDRSARNLGKSVSAEAMSVWRI